MLPPPLTAACATSKILGLKALVMLLLVLLFQSKLLRIKMSFLGNVLSLTLLLYFFAVSGLLVLIAGGSLVYAFVREPDTRAPS